MTPLAEALSGHAGQRLKRWLSGDSPLLGLQTADHLEGFSVTQPPFEELLSLLSSSRSAESSARSNLLDATVLTTLSAMNDSTPPYPRFYTTTPAILRLYDGVRRVRDLFKFEGVRSDGSVYSDTILRTPGYYYLRSMFPALKISSDLLDEELVGSPSLSELSSLAERLEGVVERGRFSLDSAVTSHRFSSGQLLQDIVDDFRGIGMTQVWQSLELDRGGPRLLDTLAKDLARVVDDENYDFVIEESWSHFPSFVDAVGDLAFQISVAQELTRSLEKVKARPGNTSFRVQDDLLAYRWALPVDVPFARAVERSVARGGGMEGAFFELVSPAALAASTTRASTVLGVLHAFGHDMLVADVYEYISEMGDPTPDCELIATASLIRRGAHSRSWADTSALSSLIRQLREQWTRASEADQRRLCLGFGYAGMLASSMTQSSSALLSTQSSETDSARFTRQVCGFIFQNLEILREIDQVQYSYAVNFLAYASLLDPNFGLETEPLFVELAQLRELRPRYAEHYRFADTMLYRDLLHGFQTGSCEVINRCVLEFTSLKEHTQSKTVSRHLSEAIEMSRSLNCSGL